jgi:alpha-tubulin suppressor-like RCC1 family protein
VQVLGLTDIVSFAAGGNSGSTGHQLAATSNGTLWGWGDDRYGQLGDGKTKKTVSSPIKAKLLSGATAGSTITGLACGADDSFVLDAAGDLYAIGENKLGSLGDGGTANTTTPILIDSAVDMVSTTSDNALDYHP